PATWATASAAASAASPPGARGTRGVRPTGTPGTPGTAAARRATTPEPPGAVSALYRTPGADPPPASCCPVRGRLSGAGPRSEPGLGRRGERAARGRGAAVGVGVGAGGAGLVGALAGEQRAQVAGGVLRAGQGARLDVGEDDLDRVEAQVVAVEAEAQLAPDGEQRGGGAVPGAGRPQRVHVGVVGTDLEGARAGLGGLERAADPDAVVGELRAGGVEADEPSGGRVPSVRGRPGEAE